MLVFETDELNDDEAHEAEIAWLALLIFPSVKLDVTDVNAYEAVVAKEELIDGLPGAYDADNDALEYEADNTVPT